MLIKFSVRNYLSFKEMAVLDMSAEALKEKKENIHIPYLHNPRLELLKSAVIYGFNAFGKSNLIKSYAFFQNFILTSFTLGKTKLEIDIEPFLLNTASAEENSYFETVFILRNTKYRYGFEVTKQHVISEWLYYADGPVRENLLFIRAGQNFGDISKSWNKESNNRIEQAKLFTKPQNLFLSVLIEQDSIPRISQIGDWFRGNLILTGNYGLALNNGAAQIYSKPEYRKTILKFLDNSDLGFSSIFEKLATYTGSGGLSKELVNFLFQSEMKNFELFTRHDVYKADYTFSHTVEFDLVKNESFGSIKFFIVVCHLAHAIKNAQLIWIDELDASLHNQLLTFIVATFNSKINNVTGSQMIFVAHNTVLLNRKMRRDQLWLIHKNEYGESSLHKAHDKKNPIRIDKSIEQDYREGYIKKGVSKKVNENNIPNLFDME